MKEIKARTIYNDLIAVIASKEMIEQMMTRDSEGHRLHVEWGEPDEYGYHNPIIHVDYEDKIGDFK